MIVYAIDSYLHRSSECWTFEVNINGVHLNSDAVYDLMNKAVFAHRHGK